MGFAKHVRKKNTFLFYLAFFIGECLTVEAHRMSEVEREKRTKWRSGGVGIIWWHNRGGGKAKIYRVFAKARYKATKGQRESIGNNFVVL